jgi:hypothetical protein
MKIAILAFFLALGLNPSAQAQSNPGNTFSGRYREFIVNLNPTTGKLKLADTDARKIYTANVFTGQEYPLDIEFLQFSRDPSVQEYADYLVSATVAAKMNSTGAIDFIIKAKANFDGGTEPQVVLVFSATSRYSVIERTYNPYNGHMTQTYSVKAIESVLHFDRVEAPQGGNLSASASLYKMLISLIARLWPSTGISSHLTEGWWW